MNLRRIVSGSVAVVLLLCASRAHAWTSTSFEEEPFGPYVERIDRAPHDLWNTRRSSVWIAIEVGIQREWDGRVDFNGMVLAGFPLERLGKGPPPRAISEGPPPTLPPPGTRPAPPPPRVPGLRPVVPPKLPLPPAALVAAEPIRIPIVVTPALARGVVNAALRKAKLFDPDERLDALATRARRAAALPELRIRVARIIDEGQSLVPTEYDPARVTMDGGTTTWLEARTTWRLDRLVFGEEEVAFERLRLEREKEQGKCRAHALDVLFAWQLALAKAGDVTASPEEHLLAELRVIETEAELDVLTGGWFTSWRAAQLSSPR